MNETTYLSEVEIDEKTGECLFVYGLPLWLIKKNKLMKYAYKSTSDLDIHIHNIKEGMKG